MKWLPILWASLGRRKVRSLLTFGSIVIAFVLFGYLAAIRMAFRVGIDVAGVDRLVVRHKVSIIQMLPHSYEARMERIPGVVDAVHASWFGGKYQDEQAVFMQAPVEPEEYLEMFPEFILPEEQRRTWLATRTGAIVGRTTAEKYGWKIGDRIPIQAPWFRKGGEQTWEFDLVGIYDGAEKATDTTQFLFHYDYFDEARADLQGMVGWYTLRVADPERSAEIAAAVDLEFANSPAETRTETEKAFVQGFAKQVGNIGAIVVAILSAVFFTILLVTGNTMAQSVRERVQEIGVLKALGFTHRGVLGLVLAEACLLTVGAGLVGLGIAWVLISGGDPTGGSLPIFFFPIRDLAIGLAATLALGLVTGIFPALQAMRLETANALRRE